MNLNRLHTSLRKDFRTLPEPASLQDFEGAFSSRYVGPAIVRAFAPMFMALLRFRGWAGKRFVADGSGLAGTNRFGAGDPGSDRIPMSAQIAPSAIDGRDALVVSYPSDTVFPWRLARDEFREFEAGKLLGITTFDLPLVRHFPLAFALERD